MVPVVVSVGGVETVTVPVVVVVPVAVSVFVRGSELDAESVTVALGVSVGGGVTDMDVERVSPLSVMVLEREAVAVGGTDVVAVADVVDVAVRVAVPEVVPVGRGETVDEEVPVGGGDTESDVVAAEMVVVCVVVLDPYAAGSATAVCACTTSTTHRTVYINAVTLRCDIAATLQAN
jgi:hypothetical protein